MSHDPKDHYTEFPNKWREKDCKCAACVKARAIPPAPEPCPADYATAGEYTKDMKVFHSFDGPIAHGDAAPKPQGVRLTAFPGFPTDSRGNSALTRLEAEIVCNQHKLGHEPVTDSSLVHDDLRHIFRYLAALAASPATVAGAAPTIDEARNFARSALYGIMGFLGISEMTNKAVDYVAARLLAEWPRNSRLTTLLTGLRGLRDEWLAKATTSREEAGRIRRTVYVATEAEANCLIRAEVWDANAAALDTLVRTVEGRESL